MRRQGNLEFDPMRTAHELALLGLYEAVTDANVALQHAFYAEYERVGFSVSGMERDGPDA